MLKLQQVHAVGLLARWPEFQAEHYRCDHAAVLYHNDKNENCARRFSPGFSPVIQSIVRTNTENEKMPLPYAFSHFVESGCVSLWRSGFWRAFRLHFMQKERNLASF